MSVDWKIYRENTNLVPRNCFDFTKFQFLYSSTTATTTKKSTTASPTTSAKISTPTTPKAPINPDDRSGSKFDGWSFFGGILLTVGVSAIGFISFKYYKVRSSHQGGANYNRF